MMPRRLPENFTNFDEGGRVQTNDRFSKHKQIGEAASDTCYSSARRTLCEQLNSNTKITTISRLLHPILHCAEVLAKGMRLGSQGIGQLKETSIFLCTAFSFM